MGDEREPWLTLHLDDLYAGALFLAGGDRKQAGDLVVETVRRASDDAASPAPPAGLEPLRVLQGVLLDRWMSSSVRTAIPVRSEDSLLRAAGAIPDQARAALWLTVICRWRYADVSGVLHIDPSELTDLLSHRHHLYSAVDSIRHMKNGTGT